MQKLSRRDALKVGALGMLGGLAALSPQAQAASEMLTVATKTPKKKKKEKRRGMTNQWIASGNSGIQIGLTTYEWDQEALYFDAEHELLGRFIGVSIFTTGVTVTGMRATYEGPVVWRDLTFVGAITNGNVRTEIWYLLNTLTGTYTIEPTFSASCTSLLGGWAFLHCGGVGAIETASGSATPASDEITTTRPNSIPLSLLTSLTPTGITNTDNQRWDVPNAVGTSIGVDKNPIAVPAATTFQFDNVGVLAWAQVSVEVLSYVDRPPAIMGL